MVGFDRKSHEQGVRKILTWIIRVPGLQAFSPLVAPPRAVLAAGVTVLRTGSQGPLE